MAISYEDLGSPDDWPPIIGVRISSDVTASDLVESLQSRFEHAPRLRVAVEEGGLSPEIVKTVTEPYAHSVTVHRLDSGTAAADS